MLNDNLLKNDSREEDKDYLEDERNRTMVFDDREECLLNKANLEKKVNKIELNRVICQVVIFICILKRKLFNK